MSEERIPCEGGHDVVIKVWDDGSLSLSVLGEYEGCGAEITKDQAGQVGRALLRLAGVDEGRVKLPAVDLSDE